MNAILLSFRRDMDAAGFDHAERMAFLAAIDKPLTEVTPAELDLMLRFEAAVGAPETGAA